MNLSQLQGLVLSWLDDLQGTYFTPAQTLVWLNNAQREVQKQLLQAGENYYVQRSFAYTVQNQDVYSLPSDFKTLNKLEVLLSGSPPNEQRQTLFPATLVQIDKMSTSTGAPAAHCIKRNAMILRPIPDNIYKLYLHYSYRVVDMALATDQPDIPLDYQEYVAVLATIDGFLKDGRDPSAFIQEKRDKYVMLMKQDSQDRNQDAPRSVIVTDGADFGFIF